MLETEHNFANRCLPMRIANQHGWFILALQTVTVCWNGGTAQEDLTIHVEAPSSCPELGVQPLSHFGHGILTWSIPVIFRSSPGINLHVKGPTNFPVEGAFPLEGIVETDWTVAPFTMNWKIQARDTSITFYAGDPICMISPLQRSAIESTAVAFREIAKDRELTSGLSAFASSREDINKRKREGTSPTSEWEKDYFFGRSPNGGTFDEHQQRLTLSHFLWEE